MNLLDVERMTARHGLLVAVRDVSFSLAPGAVLALVGANGAGKTTLLRSIAGAHRAASGAVRVDGADVAALPAHRRVAAGIALVPEGRRLFTGMSVAENLRLGATARRSGLWRFDTVLDALPQLKPLLAAKAGALSGGQQQAVAIGRALMSNPKLLLLDEISLGLSPAAVDLVYAAILGLSGGGATIILVEQDLRRAMAAASRIACMLEGRIVLEGEAGSLTREAITEAYFGLRGRERAA